MMETRPTIHDLLSDADPKHRDTHTLHRGSTVNGWITVRCKGCAAWFQWDGQKFWVPGQGQGTFDAA
jgi:hypothetical protein